MRAAVEERCYKTAKRFLDAVREPYWVLGRPLHAPPARRGGLVSLFAGIAPGDLVVFPVAIGLYFLMTIAGSPAPALAAWQLQVC
jgi:hypothetical protein